MARDRSRSPSASYYTDRQQWAEQRRAQADAEAKALLEEHRAKIESGNYTKADSDRYVEDLIAIQNRFFNDLVRSLE